MYRTYALVVNAAPRCARHAHTISLALFRLVLLARAGWNAWLAYQLFNAPASPTSELVKLLGHFFLVDGCLALALSLCAAAALPGLSLWVYSAADAAIRIGLGCAVRYAPGLPTFPVTAAIYLGIVSVVLLFDGWIDTVAAITGRTTLGRAFAHTLLVLLALVLVAVAALVSAGPIGVLARVLLAMAAVQSLILVTTACEHRH